MRLTPDGARYVALGQGVAVPRPFAYRWLLPFVCRQSLIRWQLAPWSGLLFLAVGTAALAGFGWRGFAAALMVLSLPMSLFNAKNPVLVDSLALGLATCAAAVVGQSVWLALVLAAVAGAVKEPAPLFAAVFAWNPVLLAAMVVPLVRIVLARIGADVVSFPGSVDTVEHPFRTGWLSHRGKLFALDPVLVLPWGGALVGLAALDWRLAVALGLAYGQLLLATDSVRLFQWAAPVMCAAAVSVVDVRWLPLLVVLTVFNPARGDQV